MINTILDARSVLDEEMVVRWRKRLLNLTLEQGYPEHGLHLGDRRDGTYIIKSSERLRR